MRIDLQPVVSVLRRKACLVRGRPPFGIRCHRQILLVEDDDDVRLAVSDMLKRAGYQVQEACDGLDALRQMQGMTSSPRLTITDVMMPRMTGPQFAKQIHAANGDKDSWNLTMTIAVIK